MKQLITTLFILVSLSAYGQDTLIKAPSYVRVIIQEWKFPLPYGLYTQQQWKDSCKVYRCPDENQIGVMADSMVIYSFDRNITKVLVHQSYMIKVQQEDIELLQIRLTSLMQYISNVDWQTSKNTGAINVLDTRTNNLDDKFKLFKKKRKK